MRKIDANYATDVLGINRSRWELANMARALGFHAWLNSPDETERRRVALWALRRWRAYQRACREREAAIAKAWQGAGQRQTLRAGDDYAGDAWRNSDTNEIRWTAVTHAQSLERRR